jgi:hypothetical protein
MRIAPASNTRPNPLSVLVDPPVSGMLGVFCGAGVCVTVAVAVGAVVGVKPARPADTGPTCQAMSTTSSRMQMPTELATIRLGVIDNLLRFRDALQLQRSIFKTFSSETGPQRLFALDII